jgi:hypothetical protein
MRSSLVSDEAEPENPPAAFRVRINAADCDKFLDDTKWPQHVCVSEWYFKPQSKEMKDRKVQKDLATKRCRSDSDDADAASRRKASRSDEHSDNTDLEETIVTVHADGNPTTSGQHGAF